MIYILARVGAFDYCRMNLGNILPQMYLIMMRPQMV